ncbi:malto-oligosyltrehalose trehalohydrolase [Corynebacterium sp. CCM 8864]|uniref:Malto-oligosyltrehalose trehalohydrolase n=2 Tax=Corynebacterium marambiense TaxID=2765364 RepID=A0ABS0VZI3_9CORY|nr:malto-oligosyltrehalose trehalohydrolase [Corynebacterium marambiense]
MNTIVPEVASSPSLGCMRHFSVWAPNADDLQLIVDDTTHAMRQLDDGWWTPETPLTPEPGMRYGYRIRKDSEWVGPWPDPRSAEQPDGIHGLSRVPEDTYPWSDGDWTGRDLPGQVIYELHVGTFSPSGDFAGVVDRLDHLVDLGVTTIELMPVQPFGGNRNWGYDGVLWHAVHAGYGGPEGLKKLVDAAHARGVAIILDVVYNHFGPDGNYNGFFGPYTAGGSTGWGDVVNLNGPDSNEVRRYIIDAARGWFEDFHVDGLRLDAVQAYHDPGALHLLEELQIMATEVSAATGVPRSLIAESDQNDPRLVTARQAGGYGVAGQWDDDIHHALHTLVSGERHAYYADFGSTEVLAKTLREVFLHDGTMSTFRGKRHGRPVNREFTPASSFVTYTTTHDQVGNRATGDRPSMNLSPAQQVLKAATILTSPYTPMLFMGEEFGATTPFAFFCSHTDDELNRLTGEGRKREFTRWGWDEQEIPEPSDPATFEASKLDWDFTDGQQDILDAYRSLLQLRREHRLARPWLYDIDVTHGERWVAVDRGDVVFVGNYSDEPVRVDFGGELIYSFTDPEVGADATTLDPWGFALIRR